MSLRSCPLPEQSRAAQEGLGSPQLSWSFALSAGSATGEVFAVGINTGTRARMAHGGSVRRDLQGGVPLLPSSVLRACGAHPRHRLGGVLWHPPLREGKRLGFDQIPTAFKTWEDMAKGARF